MLFKQTRLVADRSAAAALNLVQRRSLYSLHQYQSLHPTRLISLESRSTTTLRSFNLTAATADHISTRAYTSSSSPKRSSAAQESGSGPKVSNHTSTELDTMTNVQLRDLLREYGLMVSGRKAELIDRLVNHVRQHHPQGDKTVVANGTTKNKGDVIKAADAGAIKPEQHKRLFEERQQWDHSSSPSPAQSNSTNAATPVQSNHKTNGTTGGGPSAKQSDKEQAVKTVAHERDQVKVRQEKELHEREVRSKLEKERLANERIEKEQKELKARQEKEQHERELKAKQEKEQRERELKAKQEKEQHEKELKAKIERERLAKEKYEKEQQELKAKQEKERLAKEKYENEQRELKAKQEKEQHERELKAKLEKERLAKEKHEKEQRELKAKQEKEQHERELKAKHEELLAKEKHEKHQQELKAKQEKEHHERELKAKQEKEKLAKERHEKEQRELKAKQDKEQHEREIRANHEKELKIKQDNELKAKHDKEVQEKERQLKDAAAAAEQEALRAKRVTDEKLKEVYKRAEKEHASKSGSATSSSKQTNGNPSDKWAQEKIPIGTKIAGVVLGLGIVAWFLSGKRDRWVEAQAKAAEERRQRLAEETAEEVQEAKKKAQEKDKNYNDINRLS
ncbi:hypothetical protein EMPS_08667 [Entomortierella parvispora]|uniref:SAP domain-containing protein n=1 Tax=Entomortierella parvispora TaxID=205924 RepID=A0A9P3HH35_9FUNG|nr:hypothetical protein EMPS_08667 [Entomortierella parvispora]